jgi:hypothetical protein
LLTDLHGEPDRHILDLNLRLPLPLNLAQEVIDPLTGVIMLLTKPRCGSEQLVPLLPQPLGLRSVQARPLSQSCKLLAGLVGIPTSIRLLYSEAGHLLVSKSQLGHPLTSSVELLGQPSTHLRLFAKAVPNVVLLVEKLGLLMTARHEGLRKMHKLGVPKKGNQG